MRQKSASKKVSYDELIVLHFLPYYAILILNETSYFAGGAADDDNDSMEDIPKTG